MPSIKSIDLNLCIHCYSCKAACGDRFQVPRLEPLEVLIRPLTEMEKPYAQTASCRSCGDNPPCVVSCKPQALMMDEGRLEVLDTCTACFKCIEACPYDAIRDVYANDNKAAVSVCTWCNGFSDLACVSACPTGALVVLQEVAR